MTAQKTSPANPPAKHGDAADILPPRRLADAEAQTRSTGGGFSAAAALSAVGAGLAMQSATHAGEVALRTDEADLPESSGGTGGGLETLVSATLPAEAVPIADTDPGPPTPAGGTVDLPGTEAIIMDTALNQAGPSLAFAPPLGSDAFEGAGEGPVRIAANMTLPLSVAPTVMQGGALAPAPVAVNTAVESGIGSAPPFVPVVGTGIGAEAPTEISGLVETVLSPVGGLVDGILSPVLGDGGIVDTVLDPILGSDGLVSDVVETVTEGVIDPLLGEDGLLDTVLDPLLGEGGVVETVLDPVLGDGGVVETVLDPLLGEGGVVETVLDPVLGEGGVVETVLDPLLGEGGVVETVLDPLLGEGGVVETVLDPVLGEDGVVETVLDPLLGEDGVVETVLDPVLGENGVVETVLDPLLGEDGVVETVLDPLLGEGGVVETVLDPLLGEGGVVETVLDPLLGEGGALETALDPVLGEEGIVDSVLDPIIGDDGVLSGALDPVLGQDGALGGVLAPVVGAGGVLDTVLSPVLDRLGPVGALVDSILGGLFGGRGGPSAPVQDAPVAAAGDALAPVIIADDPVVADATTDGDGDDGFMESLIGESTLEAGADSPEDMADLLSTATDDVLDELLSDDYLADLDHDAAVSGEDALLSEMLEVGLTGALAQEAVLGLTSESDASDPELDALLSEILDSGERPLGGVTDPLAALLESATEGDGAEGNLSGLDIGPAVEDALETMFGAPPVEADILGSTLGDGGLLGGLGLPGSEDEQR
ncbi:hypothetical protein [Pseudotabrizicola sp. 4114]|uniref:hypothetical protein n=1 Tax=Pseudotabrizicola sp. 4114 TaxID=2817731 RepID=UPI00285B1981|nr:hypothetical protein [Pseudorhodobacter sp. 4114]